MRVRSSRAAAPGRLPTSFTSRNLKRSLGPPGLGLDGIDASAEPRREPAAGADSTRAGSPTAFRQSHHEATRSLLLAYAPPAESRKLIAAQSNVQLST